MLYLALEETEKPLWKEPVGAFSFSKLERKTMKFIYQTHANKPGIYKITNSHTGRIYIGQASSFKKRWYQHSITLKSNKHQNKFLQNDFNKCKEELGHDDFLVFEIVEVMEGSIKKERSDREEIEIVKYFDKCKVCYNIKEKVGDTDRSCHSKTPEETKKKQSESMKKRWEDPEYAASIRTILEDNLSNPEVRQKLSNASKERWNDPEYRASMSEKMIAAKGTEENRKAVSQFMKEYKSIPEVKEKTSINSKKMWESEEYRAKHKEALMATVSSKEYKDKQREGFNKRKEDKQAWIEYQKKASEHTKKLHAEGKLILSEEDKRKMSKSAKKRHAEGRNQALIQNQFKTRKHQVIDPTGNIVEIENLKEYCLIHDLDYRKFRTMAAGRRKEYNGYYPTVSRAPRTTQPKVELIPDSSAEPQK